MGWVLLLSLRFKSPGVHKWQCSKSINIVLREYYWQLRWPRKKPLDRRSMIKASMVTDCRLGMYTTVASGGSERGHNAMFLVYGAGAHPSRMGDFRESYNVKPFPWSRDTGAQKRRWVSEWRRRDAHVPGLTLTEHGLTQKSKCNEGFSQERENWQKKKVEKLHFHDNWSNLRLPRKKVRWFVSLFLISRGVLISPTTKKMFLFDESVCPLSYCQVLSS